MYTVIRSAREQHSVRTLEEYRRAHAAAIAKLQAHGHRVVVHDSAETVTARVSHGDWVTECECGAGNATDPEWGLALCFACGAVHQRVKFLEDFDEIEALLLLRPHAANRNWMPGESADELRAENLAHGVAG